MANHVRQGVLLFLDNSRAVAQQQAAGDRGEERRHAHEHERVGYGRACQRTDEEEHSPDGGLVEFAPRLDQPQISGKDALTIALRAAEQMPCAYIQAIGIEIGTALFDHEHRAARCEQRVELYRGQLGKPFPLPGNSREQE